jgi:hypothetical protein
MMINCRRRNIDPQVWLRDVFRRLPTTTTSQLDALLPANWAPVTAQA